MVNQKSHFFALTALSAAVLGLLLGAAFSFDDSDKIKNTGQISRLTAANIKPVGHKEQKGGEIISQENLINAQQEIDGQQHKVKQSRLSEAVLASAGMEWEKQVTPEQEVAAVRMETRGVLNGYKGYRHHRPGYKSAGDGWWYPRIAFSKKTAPAGSSTERQKQLTVQITEQEKNAALARQTESVEAKKTAEAKKYAREKQIISERRLISRHKEWCAAHHPSYNPSNNSYRSTFGTKHYCNSPYFQR